MGNFVSRSFDRITGRSGSQAASRAADQQSAALDESIAELRSDFDRQRTELEPLRTFGQGQFGQADRVQDFGFEQFGVVPELQALGAEQGGFGRGEINFGTGERGFGQNFRSQGIGRQEIGLNQIDELSQFATPEGLVSNLSALRGSPGIQELIGDRQQNAANELQKLGLGRSTDRIKALGDIELETLLGLENQQFNRQQGLASLNINTGGTNIDRGGNIINAGTSAVGQGANIFNQGVGTLQGSVGTATQAASIVGQGTNIGTAGANVFQAGQPRSVAPQISQFLRDKGIAQAGGTLGSEQAKAQGAENIFSLGKDALSAIGFGG